MIKIQKRDGRIVDFSVDKVINAIETMTGLTVAAVNVKIAGIKVDK